MVVVHFYQAAVVTVALVVAVQLLYSLVLVLLEQEPLVKVLQVERVMLIHFLQAAVAQAQSVQAV